MAGSVVHTLGVALYSLRRVDFTYCLYMILYSKLWEVIQYCAKNFNTTCLVSLLL